MTKKRKHPQAYDGFEVKDRGGNGDCLIRAVLHHICPGDTDEELRLRAINIRQQIAEELTILGNDNKKRAKKVKQEHTYLEQTEIPILAHILGVNIIIHDLEHQDYNLGDNNVDAIGLNNVYQYYNTAAFLPPNPRIAHIGAQPGHYVALEPVPVIDVDAEEESPPKKQQKIQNQTNEDRDYAFALALQFSEELENETRKKQQIEQDRLLAEKLATKKDNFCSVM